MQSPKPGAAAPWAPTGCSAKANSSGVGKGSPAKRASHPGHREPGTPHFVSYIYTHTFILFSLIPGVEVTVLSSPWQLHSAEKPQFSWAALLHDSPAPWVLLHRGWSTSCFLGTVFHNFHQILPWWPFPSVDWIQMLLSFKGMLPCLSLQHHQPSLLFVNFKHQSVPVSGQLATSTTFIPCKTKDSVRRVALLQCKQKQGVCIAARRWH